jgi:hypothetical protein
MRTCASTLLAGCALLLAACGPTVSGTFGEVGGEHLGHQSAAAHPMTHPSTPPGADGSIELVTEFVAGGTGISVEDAIEAASARPVLIDGILLRDADGMTWFCEALLDGSALECSTPKLFVLNLPTDPDPFEPGVAGAETRDGVSWIEGHQLFGIVHPSSD